MRGAYVGQLETTPDPAECKRRFEGFLAALQAAPEGDLFEDFFVSGILGPVVDPDDIVPRLGERLGTPAETQVSSRTFKKNRHLRRVQRARAQQGAWRK